MAGQTGVVSHIGSYIDKNAPSSEGLEEELGLFGFIGALLHGGMPRHDEAKRGLPVGGASQVACCMIEFTRGGKLWIFTVQKGFDAHFICPKSNNRVILNLFITSKVKRREHTMAMEASKR